MTRQFKKFRIYKDLYVKALLGGFYDFRQRLQSLLLKYTDENSQVT